MKRLCVIALLLAFGVIAVMGQASAAEVTPPGTLPIVKKTVELTGLAVPSSNVIDLNTNEYTKWLEKQTNVRITWDSVTTDAAVKINLLLASGQKLPDVIMGWGQIAEHYLYGSQGILKPLNKLIETQGFEIKKVIAYAPNYLTESKAADGNVYQIAKFEDCYHCKYAQKIFINRKWLDNLGLKMPSTTDEYRDALRAFKAKDPNGNGKADEVPMSGLINYWHNELEAFLMCAFIYDDGGDRLNIMAGNKVVPCFTQPEFREGLRYINGMFKEGLIDKQALIQESPQLIQLAMGSTDNRVGAIPCGAEQEFSPDVNSERTREYTALPPLKGPKGLRVCGYYPTHPTINESMVFTKDNKHLEASFRYADLMMSEGASIRNWYGVEGDDWKRPAAGTISDWGLPAKYVVLKPNVVQRSQQNVAYVHGCPFFMPADLFMGSDTQTPGTMKGGWNYEVFLYEVSRDSYRQYAPKTVLPVLTYAKADQEVIDEVKTNVNSYVNQSIARFITGEMDLDKDWDKYIKEFDSIGLKKYLGLVQKAYDKLR